MDNDMSGGKTGAVYDYGFRVYNAQIGKFLSVDPLFKSFPWLTPYQFAENRPIIAIDLDGLEATDTQGEIIDPNSSVKNDPSIINLPNAIKLKDFYNNNQDPVCIWCFNKGAKIALEKPALDLKNATDIKQSQELLFSVGLSSDKIKFNVVNSKGNVLNAGQMVNEKTKKFDQSIAQKIADIGKDQPGIRAYGVSPAGGHHALMVVHDNRKKGTNIFYFADQGASGRGYMENGWYEAKSIKAADEVFLKLVGYLAQSYVTQKAPQASLNTFIFQLENPDREKEEVLQPIKSKPIQQFEMPQSTIKIQ